MSRCYGDVAIIVALRRGARARRILWIIRNCLDLLAPGIEGRGIQVHRALAAESPTVYTDSEVLTEVIINLICNALEAMRQGAKENILFVRLF